MAKEHFVDISAHAGPQLWQPGVRHTHPSRLLAANTGQWRMTPLQTQAEVAACILRHPVCPQGFRIVTPAPQASCRPRDGDRPPI